MDFRSQIKVAEDSKKIIDEIKIHKSFKYLILELKENFIQVEMIGKKEETCKDLLNKLKKNVPRYVVYHYESKELCYNDSYIFIAWISKNDIESDEHFLYSSALMFVKHALEIENILIIDDVNNTDADKVETSMQKCLDCLFNENIVQVPAINFTEDRRGIGCIYYDRMLQNKDKIALIEGLTGKTMTYGTVLERAVSVAVNFRKMGLKYRDVVTLHSIDQIDCFIVFLGTFFLGATMCAIDTTFSQEYITKMLKQITPKIVVVQKDVTQKIETALKDVKSNPKVVVLGDTDKYTPISHVMQKTKENDDFKPVEAESVLDTVIIVFTSGSTGVPKPVCHNHSATLYQFRNFISLKFCWNRILHYATPHWTIYSKFLGIQILLGSTRIVYPNLFETLWHFSKYQPTIAFLSPVEMLTLSTTGRPNNVNLNGLSFIVGGNTVDENQAKLLFNVFYDASIYFSYGFSEIPNGMSIFNPSCPEETQLRLKKHTSVGRILPGFSFKIVDPNTEEILGRNQRGEIRIKTSFFISGYWNKDSLSLWDSHGWMKIGDLAIYDEDRCLYIVGRLKDMFKYQDYHIVPTVIENVIRTHPAVCKTAVIGKPHFVDGHHPLGFVVLKNGQNATAEELLKYVDKRVEPSHKLRGGIRIIDKLPVSSNGKVRKLALQEMILKEM